MDKPRSRVAGETIAVILLILILSVPAWYVTGTMARRSPDANISIAVLLFILMVFGLVGPGLALFFARRGTGRGNLRAAKIAAVVAALFAILFFTAAFPNLTGEPSPTDAARYQDVESSEPPAAVWAIPVIGGPIVLLAVLAWAAWGNRGISDEQKQRTEEATRALYEQSDAESKRRDRGEVQ